MYIYMYTYRTFTIILHTCSSNVHCMYDIHVYTLDKLLLTCHLLVENGIGDMFTDDKTYQI